MDTEIPMGVSGVYAIRNKVSRRLYIGASKNVRKRRNLHIGDLRKGKHSNKELQEDFNKYGDIFEVILFEPCSEDKLFEREHHWIDKYGGVGSSLTYNCLMDRKQRENMSMVHSGKTLSDETRAKISKSKQNLSDETRRKMSEAKSGENHPMFGKKQSDETKKLQSGKMKQYWADKKAGRR